MSNATSQTQATALRIMSLDGDGISVLSELTILHELMYRMQIKLGSQVLPRPCEWFQLMGGTGTGGLVAILLGKLGLSIDEATRCYLSIMGQVFDKKRVKPQDRESELERVMKEMLERYCNDANAPMMDTNNGTSTCKVVVYAMPAAAIQAGTPTCIRTYRVAENQGLECSIVEAARATMATPGALKRKTIYDGEVEVSYIGAGLGCNNPTALLLVEAGRAYPNQTTACVLSAGAGQLSPASLREPKRLLDSMSSQIAAAAEATAKDCERIHQEVAVRFSHTERLYFRFNPEQGMQDINRLDPDRLGDIQVHTKSYLEDAAISGRLNQAIDVILNGKGTAMLLNGNVVPLLQNQLPIGRCPTPSAMFTGREDLLELLRACFFDRPNGRHIVVLYGLGGAGKTQLALAFVHRYKKLFWDVFYIDATTHDTINAAFKRLAKKAKAGDTVDDALEWLTSQENRWLIVYNNADDPAIDLSDYFPSCDHGAILITTRNQDMIVHAPDPGSCCRVGSMKEGDAGSLLFKTSGISRSSESETTATTLVKHLGFLALAIVQAGAYMRSTQCNMTEYLNLFLSSRDRLLRTKRVSQTDGYKLTAYATWDVSYQNPQLIPRAAQLLGMMSFMHHDGISMNFFKAAAANLSDFKACMPLTTEESAMQDVVWDFLKSLVTTGNTWDTLGWQELTNNLHSFSLLDYDPTSQTYSIHPLVHSWCQSIISNAKTVRECTAWVLGLCVNWGRSSGDYAFRRQLLPHTVALLAANPPITPPLAANLGLIFDDARAKQAEDLYTCALKASQDRLGFDHIATLERMHNLSNAYLDQGRWKDAERLLEETIQARKRILGKEHPDVLSTMHTLASTYQSQGRWKEAEVMLLEVLEIERQALGKEHPHLLSTMYTLASTCQRQGRWNEAEAMLLEVLGVQKRVLGEEHPHLLSTMFTLASTYQKQGRWKEAEVMLLEVMEVRGRVLGEDHPHLLSTMYTLASTYQSQGRWKEAEEMLLEVLEFRGRVLREDHPHLLATMHTLALTYQSQGRWTEAETMLLEVLDIQRQALAEEHPHMLSTKYALASTYQSQGRWSKAEAMLLEVSEVRGRVLGKDHPDTLSSMYVLASTYKSQGRWKEAEAILLEVLDIEKQVLGEEHPDVLCSTFALASTYQRQGRWKAAEAMLTKILEIERRVLGNEHPNVLATMHALALTYQNQRQGEEAEALLVEVVKLKEGILGKEHPSSLSSIRLLAMIYYDQGRLSEAESLGANALEASKRVLHPQHPETLASMHNLAVTYLGQGKLSEAEQMMEEVLKLYKQVLGEQHPETIGSAGWLVMIRERLSQPIDSARDN